MGRDYDRFVPSTRTAMPSSSRVSPNSNARRVVGVVLLAVVWPIVLVAIFGTLAVRRGAHLGR